MESEDRRQKEVLDTGGALAQPSITPSKFSVYKTKTFKDDHSEPADPHESKKRPYHELVKEMKQLQQQRQEKLRRKQLLKRPPDAWRKKMERMALYNLQKQFVFQDLKTIEKGEIVRWHQTDTKGPRKTLYIKQITMKNDMILTVVDQSRLELNAQYQDRWPFLLFRKKVARAIIYINMFALNIISSKIFDNLCICIIMANSFTLATEDPLAVSSTPTTDAVENLFLALYSIEMCFKIVGLGLIFNKGAYLRDPWNILDFTIVMSAYLTITQDIVTQIQNGGQKKEVTVESAGEEGLSLNSLRAFRVLRPLRAVTSIKGLQVLVVSIMQALPLLKDTAYVLSAFFAVFAIAGVQLLMGILKNRCVSIEDGKLWNDDDEYICGARNECPEGYFCGKQNSNPNFGVTNFDNLMFALLVVFQCITLEGWSDIMIQFQQSYSNYSFILFLPIVFIGAFFLVNLTLAVINSSFSKTHSLQQAAMAAKRAKEKLIRRKPVTEEDFGEDGPIDAIGVSQYWIAKRAGKNFLTAARAAIARKQELARQAGLFGSSDLPVVEEVQVESNLLTGPVILQEQLNKESSYDFSYEINKLLNDSQVRDSDDDEVIKTQAQKTVKKDETKEIKRYAIYEMQPAHKLDKKKKRRENQEFQTNDANKFAIKEPCIVGKDYEGPLQDANRLEELLDLTATLQRADDSNLDTSSFLHPYDLSQKYSNHKSINNETQSEDEIRHNKKRHRRNQQTSQNLNQSDELSSVIVSDSSFERQMLLIDDDPMPDTNNAQESLVQDTKKQEKAKPDENQAAQQEPNNKDEEPKKKKSRRKKNQKKKKSGPEVKYAAFKDMIRNIDQEFIAQTKSKKFQDYINNKTHKIEILAGIPYQSTSTNEVFEIRNEISNQLTFQDANRFIKANIAEEVNEGDQLDQKIKPVHDAYQLKCCYKIVHEEMIEFDDDDDDALILALQPYDTVMSVGYGHLLTHKPVKFIARRSDIIVSSTMSLTLTPADKGYRPLDHALMSREEIYDWCMERCNYRASNIVTAGLMKHIPRQQNSLLQKGETKMFAGELNRFETVQSSYKVTSQESNGESPSRRYSPMKSMNTLDKSAIQGSLIELKPIKKVKMIPATLLTKPLAPEKLNLLDDEEKRLYDIQKGKYESYMRICQKKQEKGYHPRDRRFTLAESQQLMVGGHHDDDDDDFEVQEGVNMNYMGREESFKGARVEDFDAVKVAKIKKPNKRSRQDHIPIDIKSEFDLPDDIGNDYVNFNEVVKADCAKKRRTPSWSGQDVLEIGLTTDLSYWVISQINAVRVWPKGATNTLKKARVLLKMIVKHSLFDNALTLCVLLNTVIMGMEKYNMDLELIAQLEFFGQIFTWIFIGEMSSKMLAIGPKKYLSDKMNWLDGGVVSLSIVEILMTVFSGGGGDLSAFRTVRVFRTFRVLRVARLLRALKSMKVIIAVISRSAGSFVYITLLMFVFIFIYTLLGMQVFGGQFNFPDGKPRGNYDSFIIAFLTVFQVLTTENWNSVLYDSMRSEKIGQFTPVIYYVSWILIGNFILLNLFLAILLDGFVCEDDEEVGDQEELERIAAEIRRQKIKKEKVRRLKKMGADTSALREADPDARKSKKEEEMIDDVDDIDEKAIREIFMDAGLIKKKDPEREKRLLYNGISCERSFYIFSKKNWIRLFMYKLSKHKLFDNIIMALIALSSVKLAVDSYLSGFPPDSFEIMVSENIDIFMNVCFLFECITKNISMGMVMDEGSYLRESWNQLDMFIVGTSVLDMALTNVDLPVIKILRLLRTLRPLRVISHNVAMKLIVASLFESVGAIFNVMIVVVAVWLMFGIFAVNIFAGKFFYCSIGAYTYHTKFECNSAGGSWLRAPQNFDDISQAMLTLFNVASLEGWPDVMLIALDAVGVDQGPEYEASVVNGFFFIVFILIGSFFLMNFFIGVLFMKYTQAAKNETKGYTEENLVWIDIQKMIIEQKCEFDLMNKPDHTKHPKRYKYWRIVTSKPFDLFIMTFIVLNIVQMGINFENAPILYVQLLDISDYFFTVIFMAEAYLKIRAYAFRYFDTLSNKFDAFIVISSIIDILMTLTMKNASESFSLGPQLARMMRVMRVTRIVRLASRNEGLQALMQTITLSVSALMNVFLLLVLVLFIFSILFVFFFGSLKEGNIIDEYHNFNDFGQSFLYLFVISTGENWNMLMYDTNITPPNCVEGRTCGTSFAPAFFIIFVLFVQNVMLNLFILVICSQFEKYYMAEDNPITKFKRNLDVFMVTWVDFTATRSRCVKLREKRLNDFFRKLPMPIGLPPDTTDDQMKKIMLKMGIKCDDGYIYFNELLYRCMRRLYGSFRLNKRMQIRELTTQYKVYQIKLAAQAGLYLQQNQQEIFFKNTVGSNKSVNPFLQEMYYNISFNTWLNYARKMQKRVRFQQKQEIKKQLQWAAGKEYEPDIFPEQPQKIHYVQIEVEEILEFTSEGEESTFEEEEVVAVSKQLSLSELKRKQTCKPYCGTVSRNLSQVISLKKKSHDPEEFKFLGLDRINLNSSKTQRVNSMQRANGTIQEVSDE